MASSRLHPTVATTSVLVAALASPAHAGLVGHWSLDTATGSTVADSSGSGYDGTLVGSATLVPGRFGNAVALDTTNPGFVTMGNVLTMTGSFTLNVWAKTAPGDTGALTPVAKHDGGYHNGYFMAINDTGDGPGAAAQSRAHFYTFDTIGGLSAAPVNDGAWHMLTGVFDLGLGQQRLYVDGALAATTGIVGAMPQNNTAFMLGGITFSGVQTAYFRGLVDEVSMYDLALSDGQVSNLFAGPVPEPGTWALWLGGLGALGLARRRSRRSR
jgi:hypothetical protein